MALRNLSSANVGLALLALPSGLRSACPRDINDSLGAAWRVLSEVVETDVGTMSKTFFFLKDIDTSHMAENKRECYWPTSAGSDYYEPSLREIFTSKRRMRRFMAQHGLRDAGERIDPNKPIQGREKSKPNPLAPRIAEYIRQQGGTEGLRRRIKEGKGVFV